jgi:hypothetical protein
LAILVGLLVLLLPGVCAMAVAQPLVRFSQVVVDAGEPPATLHAADELAHYVQRVSGRQVPVVGLEAWRGQAPGEGLNFFVGRRAALAVEPALDPAAWKTEQWLLRTTARGLILAGLDETGKPLSPQVACGSQLAVYTFLDDVLGVKWLWPGTLGEHVPSRPDFVVPTLDRGGVPRFAIRHISIGYSRYHTEAAKRDIELWTRRTRQGWSLQGWFGHSWYYAFELKKTGDENPWMAKNPEMFALVNGKRRGPQMCTTHPAVIDRMVEFVLNDTKFEISSISPSDGAGFCQCDAQTKSAEHRRLGLPSCTELDVAGAVQEDGKTPIITDRMMTYANEIARRVRQKDPNKYVGMFAYTWYNRPPLRVRELEPNLLLSFVFQAQAFLDERAWQQWHDNVAGWQKVGARMIVREGWGNHYLLDLPFLHERQIDMEMKAADELGFIAAYGEGSKAFATQATNTWMVVRQMWDPRQDSAAVMEEFCRAAFGPAAPAMHDYFAVYRDALAANWAQRRMVTPSLGVPYVNIVNSWHILFPPSVVQAAEAKLQQARALAPAGEYADRVAFFAIGQQYTAVMLELLDCYRQLAEQGLKMEFFSVAVESPQRDEAVYQRLLRRAYELGEQREEILLKHRDLPALDEGLYAFTNDKSIRQWHTRVKKELGIEQPTRLNRDLLSEVKVTDADLAAAAVGAAPLPVRDGPAVRWRDTPLAITDTQPLLIVGEGYGRYERAAWIEHVLKPAAVPHRDGGDWVDPATWREHPVVVIVSACKALAEPANLKAASDYVAGGGRLVLVGPALATLRELDAASVAFVGATGYTTVRAPQAQAPAMPDHPDSPRDLLAHAPAIFVDGSSPLRLLTTASPLLQAGTATPLYVARHGEGRVLFVGRELFRLINAQKKAGSSDAASEALVAWLRQLLAAESRQGDQT